MENRKTISMLNNIVQDKNYDSALEGIIALDRQLKYLHSIGYKVDNINAREIVYNDYYGFANISKITGNREEAIEKNIKDFVKLSLGVMVSLDVGGNVFYDYTEYPDNFVAANYMDGIRPSIYKNADYYDDIMNSKLFGGEGNAKSYYLYDYINKDLNGKSNKNSRSLVKSTPTGKALSDIDDAAFAKTAMLPLLLGCIFIVIGIAYILITH